MAPVGIIIVTYNSGTEIGACLDALTSKDADVVVVDNASVDDTLREVRLRGVRLIANSDNRGFAAAVNQGFAVLNNPYILLLNPDAVVLSTFSPLIAACDLAGSAGAGGRLVDASGHMQAGFMARQLPTATVLAMEALLLNKLWPRNAVNRRYRQLDRDYSVQFAVEQPAGAFLMVRRNVWEELGGLDESYHPLWFEDVDFCKRIQLRGLQLYYVPDGVAKHTGGHSLPRLAVEKRRFYWYRSLLRYSFKYFHRAAFAVVCLAVAVGCFLRSVGEITTQRSFKSAAGYGRVMRLAGRSLFSGFRP
jgi:N-acetylglucosaminyl-diphospho-decaprenol L-rhamnosyltransferase